MRAMHLRRTLALLSGALLLTAPLSACGFDKATDRVNNIAAGVTDRDASLDVLNAVIVSAEEGSGTFIATFVNNDTEEEATVEALEGSESARVADFSPITVDPGGLLNLAAEEEEGVAVEGEVAAGAVVPMRVQLSGGELIELDVPVVPACGEFEGLDGTATSADEELCEIEPVEAH